MANIGIRNTSESDKFHWIHSMYGRRIFPLVEGAEGIILHFFCCCYWRHLTWSIGMYTRGVWRCVSRGFVSDNDTIKNNFAGNSTRCYCNTIIIRNVNVKHRKIKRYSKMFLVRCFRHLRCLYVFFFFFLLRSLASSIITNYNV